MTPNTSQVQQISPSDYIEIVKRRKWSLILPACLVFLAAGLTALLLPSIYISSSTILIEEQKVPDDFVMATVTSYVEQRLQAINQRIMSYSRLKEVIDQFDPYPDLKTRFTDDEIVVKMREDIELTPISADTMDRRTGRPTEATIAFMLSYEGKSPSKVQQIATVLASLFLEENIKVRSQQTLETTQFLEEEMNRVKNEITTIESNLATFKERNFNELPELLQANLQSLNTLERNLERLNEMLRSLKEREGYLQTQLASIPVNMKSEMDQNKRSLENLKIHLIDLETQYSDQYPDVINTKASIQELEKTIATADDEDSTDGDYPDNPAYITLASQLASTESEIDSIKRQVKELDKKRALYGRRIAATPNVEKQFKALIMEQASNQAKYNDVMSKLMEARLAYGLEKEQKGERFSLIEPARLPEKPYKPNRMAILLIGLVLGVGAGVGMASLREFSDRSLKNIDELLMAGFVPVMGSIPEIVTAGDRKKKWILLISIVLLSLLVLILGVWSFHLFVMDLDVFWAKLIRKLVAFGIMPGTI
jgi:succinoglycan biosynthesis transport protein ExoP